MKTYISIEHVDLVQKYFSYVLSESSKAFIIQYRDSDSTQVHKGTQDNKVNYTHELRQELIRIIKEQYIGQHNPNAKLKKVLEFNIFTEYQRYYLALFVYVNKLYTKSKKATYDVLIQIKQPWIRKKVKTTYFKYKLSLLQYKYDR